ncbi:MAG: Gfo/Idh/MocA family oxidoreductase [Clostridia bacterium]
MSFKICHIGCGSMSIRGHGPAMKKYAAENPGVILAGCCDLDLEKAREFSGMFGFSRHYTDWMDMLGKEKPDAVSVAVPVGFTAEISIRIAAMGYNLLAEKPPGMTGDECRGIIEAVRKAGVTAAAAFNRRHMPLVRRFSDILDIAGKETVSSIRCEFHRVGRKDPDFSTTAIHAIDMAIMLAGCGYREWSFKFQPLERTPVGNIYMNGVMESGAEVSLAFLPDSGLDAERFSVVAGGDAFFLHMPVWDCPDYPGRIIHYKEGRRVAEINGTEDAMFITSGFYGEHCDFYNSLRNNKPPGYDISCSLQSVEIMESLRISKNKQIR